MGPVGDSKKPAICGLPMAGLPVDEINVLSNQAEKGAKKAAVMIVKRTSNPRKGTQPSRDSRNDYDRILLYQISSTCTCDVGRWRAEPIRFNGK